MRLPIPVSLVLFLTCFGSLSAPLDAQTRLDSRMRGFPLGGEASGEYFAFPSGQAVADLDGDGDLDMAYANGATFIPDDTPVLSVIMNDGDGMYSRPVLYTAPVGPTSAVVAADLDGDGDPDLALTQQYMSGGDSVLVFLNDGQGHFSLSGIFKTGTSPNDITAADFDGDGHIDLATVAWTNTLGDGRTVSVLFNDSAAGFSRRRDLPVGDIPYFIAAGDLNRDGAADIVYSYYVSHYEQGELGVILSDGAGGFLPFQHYSVPGRSGRVAVGDLDEDGLSDVVFGSYKQYGYPGAVAFFRNLGAGVLDAGTPVATVLERYPVDLDLADVDGDGHLDIAFTAENLVEDGWGYVPGHGDGSFGTAEFFTTGDWVKDITIGDATGDGRADALVTVNHALFKGSGSLNVHAQEPGGGFSLPPKTQVDGRTMRLDVADVDLDGDLDVVTARSTSFISLLNDGAGNFTTVREPRVLSCMQAIRLADLSGDGYPDLILTKHPDCPNYDLYTAINDGDGTFGELMGWYLGSAGDNEHTALDYDNDGDLDIVVSESLGSPGGHGQVLLYLMDNKGDGTFEPARLLRHPNQGSVRRVEAADINADGNMDVIGSSADRVTVMLGDGAGNFPSITEYFSSATLRSGVSWVMPADMNGDGHLDVAYGGSMCFPIDKYTDTCIPAVGIMLGDGTGALVPGGYQLGPDGSEMYGLDVADFDGDGHLDILGSAKANAEVVVFRGLGDGRLLPGERFGVDTSSDQSHAGDFDGDGSPDAVVVGSRMEGVSVSLLRNLGSSSCEPDIGFGGPGDAVLSVCGDLSSGGSADVLLENASANELAVAVASLSFNPTPFRGGWVVPVPPLLLQNFMTSSEGRVEIPGGIPGGYGPADLYLQFAIVDAAQSRGFSFSNAVRVRLLP